MFRAALLAVRMTLTPVAALDWTRHLRVAPIVWVLRRKRVCRTEHRRRRRSIRW